MVHNMYKKKEMIKLYSIEQHSRCTLSVYLPAKAFHDKITRWEFLEYRDRSESS